MDKKKPDRKYLAKEIVATLDATTSHRVIASWLGVEHSTVSFWCSKNVWITAYQADRYAVKLGFHPCEIWDDWFTIESEVCV